MYSDASICMWLLHDLMSLMVEPISGLFDVFEGKLRIGIFG